MSRNIESTKRAVVLLLLVTAGCGEAAMPERPQDFASEVDDQAGNPGPNPADSAVDDAEGRAPGGEPDDRNAPLPKITDMRPELLLLGAWEHHVWGSAPDDLFLASGDGVVARFDGQRWWLQELPDLLRDSLYVNDIFGFSSSDVFIAGSGVVGRFDGLTWSAVELPGAYEVASIWGSAPDDVYAVSRSRIYHFDGESWIELQTGLRGDVRWESICGFGTGSIFVAGRDAASPWNGALAEFDGSAWSEIEIPTGSTLWDCYSPAPGRAVAVGSDARILHYDQGSLSQMFVSSDSAFQTVWGTSASEIFAGGGGGMFRFDGERWTRMPEIPSYHADRSLRITSVFGFGGNQLYASGEGLYRFDGVSWETELSAANSIEELWAGSPDDALMLGSPTHRFDGERFVLEDLGTTDPVYLRAAWGDADDLFAVGAGGTIMHYDGEHWRRMTSNTTATFFDVWGSSSDNVLAVAYDGVLMRFNGWTWGGIPTGTTEHLTSVWGSDEHGVYVGGYGNTMLHFDGIDWAAIDTGGQGIFWDIFGFSDGNVYSTSHRGLLVGDSLGWREEEIDVTRPNTGIRALHGTSPDNLFGADYDWFAHYDGREWTPLQPGPQSGVQAVLALGPRDVLVAYNTAVLRYHAE